MSVQRNSIRPARSQDLHPTSAPFVPHPTSAVTTLKAVIQQALKEHRIKHVVIYVRVSPNPEEDDSQNNDAQIIPSIERQVAFLGMLVPADVTFEVYKDRYTSASSGSSLETIAEIFKRQQARTCLLSTSVDRVIRKVVYGSKLSMCLRSRFWHIAMALLWDSHTIVDCSEGLQLTEKNAEPANKWRVASTKSRRAPPSSLNLPTIEPIIWCNHLVPLDSSVSEHVMRHLQNAEGFVTGLLTRFRYRAGPLPQKLSKVMIDEGGKAFSAARAQRWREFLIEDLSFHENAVSLEYTIDKSGNCSCNESQSSNHDEMCQCHCPWCEDARRCPCTRGDCKCPDICNCRCSHCHKNHQVLRPRICRMCGEIADPRGTQAHAECPSCFAESKKATSVGMMCHRQGCYRPAQSRMIWCSIDCYVGDTDPENVRYCPTTDCTTPIPPGLGLTCQRCYRAKKEAEQSPECRATNCTNPRLKKTKYCSVACYVNDTPPESLKRCSSEDCTTAVPPGKGQWCDRCHNQQNLQRSEERLLNEERKRFQLREESLLNEERKRKRDD